MPPEANPRTAQNERERPPSIHARLSQESAPQTRNLRPALRWTQGPSSRASAVRGSNSGPVLNMLVSTLRALPCLCNPGSLASLSKLTSQFGVGAAFDLRGIYALECVVELHVVIPQQILSHDTQAQRFPRSPCQLRVQPRVGSHGLRWQSSDKIGVCIPLKTSPQFKVRAELRLMLWVRALRVHHACCVRVRGVAMQMHLQEGITRAERPAICYFPFDKCFDAAGRAMQFVVEKQRENQ